jgi:hypothetical protein
LQSTYYLAAIVFIVGVLIVVMVSPLIFSNNNRTNEGTTTTSTKERIDVRARPITVPSSYYGTITGYHLFIVYTDGAGKQFICEALPLDPNTGRMPSNSVLLSDPDGLLTRGYCQPYLSGATAAYVSSVASVTAATTAIKAKEAFDCFVKETVAFNAANIPYHLTTGPNSNSYVRTLLDHCEVPAVKPPTAVLTPGWDISISFES